MLTQELFDKQKALLDQFLKTGAINQAQYDKSFATLKATLEHDLKSGCRNDAKTTECSSGRGK